MTVRFAVHSDLIAMVKLAEQQHVLDEQQQPMLWRKAKDSTLHQLEFYEGYLQQDNALMMVSQFGSSINGVIVAHLQEPPPIYDLPGCTCIIEDFVVESPSLWQTVGRQLFDAITEEAKNLNAVQMVIVSHTHNKHKQLFLQQMGLTVASQWHSKVLE